MGIAVGLTVNLATSTVHMSQPWWPALIWTLTAILILASVAMVRNRRRSPDTESGQPEHEEPPEPPRTVGEDLRGLDDDQVQLLRSSAAALRNLLMVIGEAERTPLLSQREFAEASARLQTELNRTEAQLHALKGAVTLLTWPDREWAAEFTAERDTVERELHAAQRRNASGASNQRQQWPCESAARLLGLLQRYPSLFTTEHPDPHS
jgi:hypothetical protein